MYITHGDTIVFRSDRQERYGTTSRLPERRAAWESAKDDRRLESLRERIEVLEDRMSRLEARLSRALDAAAGFARAEGHRIEGHRIEGHRTEGYRAERHRTEEYRADGSRRAGRDRSGGYGAPGDGEARPVRVSLQAGGGAQVSLGEVRLIQRA